MPLGRGRELEQGLGQGLGAGTGAGTGGRDWGRDWAGTGPKVLVLGIVNLPAS